VKWEIVTKYYARTFTTGINEIRNIKSQAGLPKVKPTYSIPKKSAKRLKKEAEEKQERGDDDTELVKWFKNRIKQLTGHCSECHARTETKVYQYAIYSVCHILEKRANKFPSVKTHPLNFIELCPDHHNIFDKATWEEREMMGCWNIVWKRLLMVYDSIDKSELHHIPTELRERIEKANNPFGE